MTRRAERHNTHARSGMSLLYVFVLVIIFSIVALAIFSLLQQYKKNLSHREIANRQSEIAKMLESTLINSVAALSYTVAKCETGATNTDYANFPQNPIFCHCFKKKNCLASFDGRSGTAVPAYPPNGFPFYLYRSDPQNAHQPIAGSELGVSKSDGSDDGTTIHATYKSYLVANPTLLDTSFINSLRTILLSSNPAASNTAASNTAGFFNKILAVNTVSTTTPILIPPESTVRYSAKGERCSADQFGGDTAKFIERCPFSVDLSFKVGGTDGKAAYTYSPTQIQICYQVNHTPAAGGPQLASISNQVSGRCTTLAEIMDRAAGKYYGPGGSSSFGSSSPGSGSSSSGTGGAPPPTSSLSAVSDSSSSNLVVPSSDSSASSFSTGFSSMSSASSTFQNPGPPWTGGPVEVNGTVTAITTLGSTVYLAGSFTEIGRPNTRGGALLDLAVGFPLRGTQQVDGTVKISVSDGNGGYYIGGSFTKVGAVLRNNIAHIRADGSVDPNWNPGANGEVSAIAVSGNTVYVGGNFTTIGANAQARNRIAALDAAGNATAWNPILNAQGIVYTIAASSSTLYVGGDFTSIGGQSRSHIAAFDVFTGILKTWNPVFHSSYAYAGVYTIVLSSSTIYAGGAFDSVGGQSRNSIAAFDIFTEALSPWNPDLFASGWPTPKVRTIVVSGPTVYVGGNFTSIGGQARNGIAALSTITGSPTSWNSNANDWISTLVAKGSTIYAAGNFTSIGGQARNGIAALDATTGNATSWHPNMNGDSYVTYVNTIALSGSTIYVGGNFTSIGGQTRNSIAALDVNTGVVATWNTNMTGGTVNALASDGSSIYVGGDFTSIGGVSRNKIAALHPFSGLVTPWNPQVTGYGINAIAASGSTVYVGGAFTTIGGQTRTNMAALDAATGAATGWDPGNIFYDCYMMASAASGNSVYAVSNGPRKFTALDGTTGAVTAWNTGINSSGSDTIAIAANGNTVYVGGLFTAIGGQARNSIAALDATTGNVTPWNPQVTGLINAIAVSGSTVYVGGSFTRIGGQSKANFAPIDIRTGLVQE